MIVKDKKLEGIKFAALVFMAFASAFSYGLISLFSLWQPPLIHDEKGQLLKDDPYYFCEDLIFVTGNIRNPLTIIHIFYATILTNFTYLCVAWPGFKVWKHLKLIQSQMSSQTRDIHNQMNKALIWQALIPFFTCLLPIGITILMIVLQTNINGFGAILSFIFSWIPLANSATTIFIVKSYSKIVIKYLKHWIFKTRKVGIQAQSYSMKIT